MDDFIGQVFVWGFLILIFIGGVMAFNSFHSPTNGEHTGYVTAVENSGLIFHTWTAYFKTNTQASQEDKYCAIDSNLISELQTAEQNNEQVTITYSNGFFVPPWQCGGGTESIITGIQ